MAGKCAGAKNYVVSRGGRCDNGAGGGKRTQRHERSLRQKARLALLSKNSATVLKARKILLRRSIAGKKKGSKIRSLAMRLIEEQARSEKLQSELNRAREGMQPVGALTDTVDVDELPIDLTDGVNAEVFAKPHSATSSSLNKWQESDVLPTDGFGVEAVRRTQIGAQPIAIEPVRNAGGSAPTVSLASIAIAECKPSAEDDEIHRLTFEKWVELLNDLMELAGVSDERTKFMIFKVKAGPRLLEIFRNTVSTLDTPSAEVHPYQNALCRLESHFRSSSYLMLQRRMLSTMTQQPEESDRNFVLRVAETARYCGYGEEPVRDEVINVVSQRARNKEIRAFAVTLIGVENNFLLLLNKIREMLAIRINEESVSKNFSKQEPALVAPVLADRPRQERYKPYDLAQRRYEDYRDGRSGSSQQYRQPRTDNRSFDNRVCWRCGNSDHLSDRCWARVCS